MFEVIRESTVDDVREIADVNGRPLVMLRVAGADGRQALMVWDGDAERGAMWLQYLPVLWEPGWVVYERCFFLRIGCCRVEIVTCRFDKEGIMADYRYFDVPGLQVVGYRELLGYRQR